MSQVSLARLTRLFAWIGLTSLGGGRAAYLYEAFVLRRRWLSSEEFVPGLTLSQILPGPTVSNLAVFVGSRLGGVRGAMLGATAVLVPGAAAILLLAYLYFDRGVPPAFEPVLRGMGAAVVGFLFVTTVQIARPALRGRGAPWIGALTFLAVTVLRLNIYLVLLLAGGVSLWLNRPAHAAPRQSPPTSPETNA